MSIRRTLVTIAVAAAVVVSLAGATVDSQKGTARSTEARARAVAAEFIRTINAKRFEQTCRLLSTRFYRQNHIPTRARCVLGLRIGLTGAPTYRFRILGVRVDAERAVVQALANGVPGQLVLVAESGGFRVSSVRGS
jgi:hypothetical protein